MTRTPLLAFLAALVIITGVSLWLNKGPAELSAAPAASELAPAAGAADIGGPFSLTDQNKKTVTDKQFRGKLMLVFFGFTHCPDICPVTLSLYTDVLTALGEKSSQVAPIMISVDPVRDTPVRLKEYLSNFHPAIVGLTGSKAQVETVLKSYKAYAGAPTEAAESHEHGEHHAPSKDYIVPHSGLIYLMDRDGKYLAHFSQEDTAETLTAAITRQLQ